MYSKLRSIPICTLALLVSCGGPAGDTTFKDIKSADPQERASSLLRMAAKKDQAKKVIPLIVKALDEEEAMVRAAALSALAAFGEDADPCLEKLHEMSLEDPEASVRMSAVSTLSQLAPSDSDTLATLTAALQDKDFSVASKAAMHILQMGDQAAEASAELAGFIKSYIEEQSKRGPVDLTSINEAAMGLAGMGVRASAAAATLESILAIPSLPRGMSKVVRAMVKAVQGSGSVKAVDGAFTDYRASSTAS